MVSSLNIKLSGEQIRSVIRAIDLDGGGFVDFPEFEAAVKRHEDVRGVQATLRSNSHAFVHVYVGALCEAGWKVYFCACRCNVGFDIVLHA